jgi:hypothetical protein
MSKTPGYASIEVRYSRTGSVLNKKLSRPFTAYINGRPLVNSIKAILTFPSRESARKAAEAEAKARGLEAVYEWDDYQEDLKGKA